MLTRLELLKLVRRLRLLRDGEIFQAHDCRLVLAEARKIEDKLAKYHERLWELRRKAEKAFVEGWPNVSPWGPEDER